MTTAIRKQQYLGPKVIDIQKQYDKLRVIKGKKDNFQESERHQTLTHVKHVSKPYVIHQWGTIRIGEPNQRIQGTEVYAASFIKSAKITFLS